MFLGHKGDQASEENGSRHLCHLLAPCTPPSSPHTSAFFISWALMVSPRTTMPVLLSLHAIGPVTKETASIPSTHVVLHSTDRH